MVTAASIAYVCATAPAATAQYPRYRPHGYLPYGVRGYGYRMPGTALSAARFGMARMIAASGYANMMNSRAVKSYAAARAANIRNRAQWTNSYYQMRQAHRAYEANRTHLTMEEITKIAQDAAPKRLDIAQLDSTTGKITWPTILREARYNSDRDRLDTLYRLAPCQAVALDADTYREIWNASEHFKAQLKANLKDYSAKDFEQARHFLDSLRYEAHFSQG